MKIFKKNKKNSNNVNTVNTTNNNTDILNNTLFDKIFDTFKQLEKEKNLSNYEKDNLKNLRYAAITTVSTVKMTKIAKNLKWKNISAGLALLSNPNITTEIIEIITNNIISLHYNIATAIITHEKTTTEILETLSTGMITVFLEILNENNPYNEKDAYNYYLPILLLIFENEKTSINNKKILDKFFSIDEIIEYYDYTKKTSYKTAISWVDSDENISFNDLEEIMNKPFKEEEGYGKIPAKNDDVIKSVMKHPNYNMNKMLEEFVDID